MKQRFEARVFFLLTLFQNFSPPFLKLSYTALSPFPYQIIYVLLTLHRRIITHRWRLAGIAAITVTALSVSALTLADLEVYYSLLYVAGPLMLFVTTQNTLLFGKKHRRMLFSGFALWVFCGLIQDLAPGLTAPLFQFLIDIPVEFERSNTGRGMPALAYEPSVSADYLGFFVVSYLVFRLYGRSYTSIWLGLGLLYFVNNRSGTFLLNSVVLCMAFAIFAMSGIISSQKQKQQTAYRAVGVVGLLALAFTCIAFLFSDRIRAFQALSDAFSGLGGTSEEGLIKSIVELTFTRLESWRTVSVAACFATLSLDVPFGFGLGGWRDAIPASILQNFSFGQEAEWISRPFSFGALVAVDLGWVGLLACLGLIIWKESGWRDILRSPTLFALLVLCVFQIAFNTTRSLYVPWIVLRIILDNGHILNTSAKR